MIKGSIYQEDTMCIITKKQSLKINETTDTIESTIIAGGFNSPFSAAKQLDRKSARILRYEQHSQPAGSN